MRESTGLPVRPTDGSGAAQRKLANDRLLDIMQQIRAGTYSPPKGRRDENGAAIHVEPPLRHTVPALRSVGLGPLFRDVVALYEGTRPITRGRKSAHRKVKAYWGDYRLGEITKPAQAKWLRDDLAKYMPETKNTYIKQLNAIMNYLVDEEELYPFYRAMKGVRAPKVQRTITMTLEQRDKVLAACEADLAWMRPLVATWSYTGCRPGESCRMSWDLDVRYDAARHMLLRFVSIKGGVLQERLVPADPVLQFILEELPYRAGALLRTKMGLEITNYDAVQTQVYKAWRKLRKICGLPDNIVPYTFRHTFITDILETTSNSNAGQLAGTNELEKYNHARVAHFKDVIATRPGGAKAA